MNAIEKSICDFWNWFAGCESELAELPLGHALDLICDRLATVHEDLSAEVEDSPQMSKRIMYVTAHGNRDLFQLVEAIAEDEVSLSCWEIKPFKPPRDSLQALADDTGLDVAEWRFIPLKSDTEFSQIGLMLIIDPSDAKRLDHFRILSILEHIVGEVLLAACSYVEVTTSTDSESMPIEILMETLHSWVLLRGDDQLRQYLPVLD